MAGDTRKTHANEKLPQGTRAMILAAGLGTRLKPWTDLHPKALALVNGKSLLQRNVEYLQQYGISDVVVNVHHFPEQVTEAIHTHNGWGSNVSVSDETGAVLETGGGLKKAAGYFTTGDFVVINVDVLTSLNLHAMFSHHRKHQPLATLAVSDRQTSRYFLFDAQNDLCGWRNTASGEEKIPRPAQQLFQKAFSGIHIIHPSIFSQISREGKFSMVDVYLDLAPANIIKGFDHSGAAFIDVGKPGSVAEAERLFR